MPPVALDCLAGRRGCRPLGQLRDGARGMSAIKRSLGIAFLTQYAELVIQFVGLMFLARIITSEQVGIYSVAALLMALLHVFRDFGVAKYIIQSETLTVQEIRSSFGVAYLLAFSMALVLLASSGAAARFYNEPQVKDILVVMSASFAITPVGSVLSAILRRNMQLKRLAAVRVGSTVCHVVVSLALAMLGYGAMSLAWANFASIVSFGVLAALLRPAGVPFTPSFRKMRAILSFGSISSLGNLVSVAGTNSPDVIIGKVISLAATGYFSRGNGLVQMFKTLINGAIVPLVLPYFSQLRRDKADMVAPYRLAIAHLTGFAWPFFAVMALLALPVVRTLYGPNWDVSVPIVRILCLAGAVSTLATFAGEVMIAYGHINKVTKMQLLTQPVRVLAVLGGAMFGLEAVAWSLVGAEAIALLLTSHFLKATTGVHLRGVLSASFKSAIVTVASAVGPALVVLAWPPHAPIWLWLQLAAGGGAALAGWLVAIMLTGHPVKQHLQQARLRYLPGAPWGK